MQFGEIYGNDALKARLKKMVDEDRLSHAILFVEQEGMGGLAFALALAQYINCMDKGQDSCGECPSCRRIAKLAYPDVHFAFPVNTSPKLSDQEKKKPLSSYFLSDWNNLVAANPYFDSHDLYEALGIENKAATISVHEAREIASTLALQPFESDYKIMIIWQPEKMNTEAANKLLKLLEEPPAGTYFLMVTQSLESMLTTVRSRCQIIRLQPMEREEIADVLCKRYELERPLALDFATLAGGSIGKAFSLVENADSGSTLDDLLRQLLDASLGKSLPGVLDAADALAALGKDKQKQWCVRSEGFIRKMFLSAKGLEGISFAGADDLQYIKKQVPRIKDSFYPRAAAALDAALRLIDSNVSAKLIFTDLGNRFYLYI